MLRIHNVKVPLGKCQYRKLLSQVLNVRENDLKYVKLIKQSIDARRQSICFICSFDFEVDDEERVLKSNKNVKRIQEKEYPQLQSNSRKVVIVGSGVSGMFCGYVLSLVGQNVTIIDKGCSLNKRQWNQKDFISQEDNLWFGEGGSYLFSNGQIHIGKNHLLMKFILDTLVQYGASPRILYLAKSYLTQQEFVSIISNMKKVMLKNGVKFIYETECVDFFGNDVINVTLMSNRKKEIIEADDLIFATGVHTLSTYRMLKNRGIIMERKPFAFGLCIEHLQKDLNMFQYKKSENNPYLEPAGYQFAVDTSNKYHVFTHKMCPKGSVISSCYNQRMSVQSVKNDSCYDGYASGNILLQLNQDDYKTDDCLEGFYIQKTFESKLSEMCQNQSLFGLQRLVDFMNCNISQEIPEVFKKYDLQYRMVDYNDVLSKKYSDNLKEGLNLMNKKMPGFINDNVMIVGVSSCSLSAVRILRNNNFETNIPHVYVIGDGSGYTKNMISSMCDGVLCAQRLLRED